MSDSTEAFRRRERTREDDDDRHVRQCTGRGDEEQERRILPVGVLAVAAMNNRSRLFIPGKENFFAGIHYEFVMIDNGCNSLLLPFPEPPSQLDQFRDVFFSWSVSHSRGTPTLTIKRTLTDIPIGQMKLTLSDQEFPFIRLRFHITKAAAIFLKNNSHGTNLNDRDIQRLNDFLTALGPNDSKQRRHVLLGQQFLKDKMCVQNDPVFVIATKTFDGPLQRTLAEVRLLLDPAVEEFTEFHDLEDEDHDGDDDEEGRPSWGPEDDVDECDD
mmetsp:Transcript_32050/g.49016  ORF Transcript_32050/g.49016 Transcript_32050/m.49016 type:complete len:271 (-) Transcript_32050:325-1137(-)